MVKIDLVKDYLESFPNTPSLTLARTIYEENKEIFGSVEAVRSQVRTLRGANGKQLSSYGRRFVREFTKDLFNPFKLPESDEKEFEPFVIPLEHNDILVMGDLHMPYHSISAITVAMQYGLDKGVNTILLNGDIVDFHQLSKFVKNPKMRHFQQELETWREFIQALREAFPTQKIYYKQGNHEERLETYLKVKAPELYGMKEFELDALCDFTKYGIEYIKDKRTIKAGNLNILHGHELRHGMIPPVNPARGIFLRAKGQTLANHWHTTSQHSEKDIDQKYIKCWTSPCLCELNPEYSPNNNWNNGFAHVKFFENGHFNVDIKDVINGEII